VMGSLLLFLLLTGVLVWKILDAEQPMRVVPLKPTMSPQNEDKQLGDSVPMVNEPVAEEPEVESASPVEHEPEEAFSPMHVPLYSAMKVHGVALIIDDVGYDLHALQRLLNLSVPMAISILPNAPKVARSAKMAHQAGQVVMLHLPMEPSSEHYRARMDSSFLTVDMDEESVRRVMLQHISAIPYIEGVNNHMGSRLTSMADSMSWVMQVCREKNLFFVDSKTSGKSVAATMAKTYGLPWGSRTLFLDDSIDMLAMNKMWHKIQACVAQERRCIVIAHPHRESVAFLEQHQEELQRWPMLPVQALLHMRIKQ